jgi:hypothetical protein
MHEVQVHPYLSHLYLRVSDHPVSAQGKTIGAGLQWSIRRAETTIGNDETGVQGTGDATIDI